MKHTLLTSIILLIMGGSVLAQNVNIPDANFKAYLVGSLSINTNEDSEIQVSEANAYSGTMNCSSNSISDLTGIEEFVNLTKLTCNYNSLTELDLSQNTALTEVYVASNNLYTLDVSECTALTKLNFQGNNVSSLDITQCTALTELYCNYNSFNTIDLSQNTALTFLACNGNLFSSIDLSQNTAIETLFCGDNPNLSSLDLSNNTSLVTYIGDFVEPGSLSTIILGQNPNLSSLECNYCGLNTLDLSGCPNVVQIYLSDNNLNSLDLSANSELTYMVLANNDLSSLDLSNNTNLQSINCAANNLSVLNLQNISTSTGLYAVDNPNLSCIQVDDVADATANWTLIDATASFSLDCNYPLSVDETGLVQNITIYPNPAEDVIKIRSNEKVVSTDIINSRGGKVASNLNSDVISVSHLPQGVYILRVFTTNGVVNKRFVKN